MAGEFSMSKMGVQLKFADQGTQGRIDLNSGYICSCGHGTRSRGKGQ